MWVLIFGLGILGISIILFIFLVQYAQNQNKNDHKIFASYKNSMIGSNLAKIQSSLQSVNYSTSKYLTSPQVSGIGQILNRIFENIFNYAINFFKFFWGLQPINSTKVQSESFIEILVKESLPESEELEDQKNKGTQNNNPSFGKNPATSAATYKRNLVNPKEDSRISIEEAKIKTHSTLILGQETDDEELLGDLNKKNDSLVDNSNSKMSKEELFKLEKFTLSRFNQARGYSKLDIALDLAEIYGSLNQMDLQKELYLWVLNKTSSDDIRHRVVNKLIAN